MELVRNTQWRAKCDLILAFCILFALGDLSAQTDVWKPSPGHAQISIWPAGAPDLIPIPEQENYTTTTELIADKQVVLVNNVSQPTMTVYAPKGMNTGAAVVVFPGGGYNVLAIDLEGTEICDWLTSRGITAVLVKYRVPTPKMGLYGESTLALQDAQRTMRLVRFHAAEWHIDPHKIGVIGFSAGGHIVAALSTQYDKHYYPAVDVADQESSRPDFAIALYPGHLWHPNKDFVLNTNVPVTSNTPPTFLLHAENDPVDNVNHSLVYYIALKNADVPVEMHLYAEGEHAFGLRRTQHSITRWPELVETWLETIWITSENPQIRGMVDTLSSDDWREREQAAETLGKMGLSARGATDLLIERLADEEWQVRKAAATALSHLGPLPEQAIPSLITALVDAEWQVRKSATEALAVIGPTSAQAVPALIKALGDKEWQVRSAAAFALAEIGASSKPALNRLIVALDDGEWKVRKHAAKAIGAIGMSTKPTLFALRHATSDQEDQVRRAATEALNKITNLSNKVE